MSSDPRATTLNTLKHNVRTASIEALNAHLAAAIDLHGQVKQAHWNVRGPNFIGLHRLFDEVSEAVEGYSDLVAERAGALGGTAHGTAQVAVERSFLKPYRHGLADGEEHVVAVAEALADFGKSARKAIAGAAEAGDADTADLFTQVSRGVDQQLWLVESHLASR